MSDRKRLLSDIRVVDLRAELERRNLDKSGVRGVLIQRLSKYIEDEGHDPATYMLDISYAEEVKSTPTKRIRRIESTLETPIMVDMIVQDVVGDHHDAVDPVPAAEPAPVDGKMDVDESKPCLDSSLRDIKDGTEATKPIKPYLNNASCDIKDITEVSQHKESSLDNHLCDIKNDTEATQPIKPCHDDDHKGDNNMDIEDTINLELCVDELLNEEVNITYGLHGAAANDAAANDAAANDAAANDAVANDAAANDTVAHDAMGATDSTTSNDQQVNAEAPAASNEGDKGNEDNKDYKDGDKRKDNTKEGGARNLWVSGLSGATRATDLKHLCSKYGKVIGAKVVTNARTPGSRCYGYVTLASTQDAENCIKNLHKTKLQGRMMSVEKARSESESSSRRQAYRPERRASKDGSKENEDVEDGDKNDLKPKMDGEVSTRRSASHSRGKSHRSDKDKGERSTRSRERRNWKEQNLERARELRRARDQLRVHRALERERRARRVAAEREMHAHARRQRHEKHRLALEYEQLRAERVKIEREKTELLRLERERHRLERERLELERLELRRAQLRLEVERPGRMYESSAPRRSPPAPAYERARRERPAPPPASSSRSQLEVPPPPRFETGAYERSAGKRYRDHEYKRVDPRHVSSGSGSETWAGAAPRYAAGYETRCPPALAYQPPPGAGAARPGRYYSKY